MKIMKKSLVFLLALFSTALSQIKPCDDCEKNLVPDSLKIDECPCESKLICKIGLKLTVDVIVKFKTDENIKKLTPAFSLDLLGLGLDWKKIDVLEWDCSHLLDSKDDFKARPDCDSCNKGDCEHHHRARDVVCKARIKFFKLVVLIISYLEVKIENAENKVISCGKVGLSLKKL